MSGHEKTPHDPAQVAAPAAGGGQLRRMMAELQQIPLWAKRNPLRAAATGGVLVVLPLCLVITAWYFWPEPPPPPPTLTQALNALDARDYENARKHALIIRSDPTRTYQEQGGPLYVLGLSIAADAEAQWNPRERGLLFLVAAKYLQEAKHRGFPEGREPQAEQLLGRYWHLAGEPARSIPALLAALEHATPPVAETHRLLAEAYLHLIPPQPEKARRHNAAVLADESLPAPARAEALLRGARIELALGNFAKGHAALDLIPADSPVVAEVAVWRAQLLLAESDRFLASNPPRPAEAQQLVVQAADALGAVTGARAVEKDPPLAAQYLLGICLARQGRNDEALEQFAHVRRGVCQWPEQIAAALHEVELRADAKDFAAAVELAGNTLVEAEQLSCPPGPWLALDAIPERLARLHEQLVAAGEFGHALELAECRAGIVPAWQIFFWKATAYQARAASAELEAQEQPPVKAEEARAAARADHRLAGREFAQLAKARELSREYIDDLWNSAEQFSLGRDYRRTIAMTQRYLRSESRKRRPEALLLLAESQLSLGQVDDAIASLTECLENFPKHPVAYRARIVAAQANAERGLLAEARLLLLQNVESDELSPRSDPWRDSLFLLGKLQHREGTQWEAKSRAAGVDSQQPERVPSGLRDLEQANVSFRGAIEQLTKALERYPESPLVSEARYLLAESYRQAAKWPRKQMQVMNIEATRAALARQNQQDLEAAVAEYDRLITQLGDSEEASPQTDLEKSFLRNGYFAKSDALFDLGRYDEAIKAYSAATNRYQNDPESLEAYVQIAACYRMLDKPGEARGTLGQAKAVLARMKPEIDFTRTTPYNRDQWQQLLTWLATL